MQKNKKLGFTLIELLAVIVILALIALITVPIIGNVVESSRKESIKISSDNYIRILEEKAQINLIDEDLKSKRIEVGENGKYIYNGEENTLDIKGKIPTSGTVCVDSNGKVDSYSVVIDDYVASNTNGTVKIEKGNTKLSLTCDVTKEIIEIEIPEDNLVCSKSKNISIKYPNYVETVKEYKIDDGDWQVYNGKFEIKKNGVIYARLRDTRNNEVSGTATLVLTKVDNDKVDKTAPRLNLSPENPTKEIVATFLQKDNCGLDEKTIEYAISESESGPFTYQKSNTFKKLKNNTTYYIRTRANDIAGNGISESEVSSIKTEDFKDIVIQADPVSWSSSKTVKITGETKGATLEYKMVSATTIKTDWSTIKSGFTTKIDWAANVNIPTYIYARQTDGDNISNTATYTVVTNDITEPELILGNSYITTKSIKIPITLNRDLESDIDNTTCKYGENTNYSYSGKIVNNECVISNLKSGTKYYYRVETINKAGLNKVVTGDTDTGSSSIKIDLVSYPDNTTYAQYKTAKVKFSQEKITNPTFYIKTTVATTGSINGISCGTGNDPSTCQGTSTTNYAANTWYKVNSNTDVKFTSNGTLYARINDGEIYSSAETMTITKIDTTPPILATGEIYKTTSYASLPFTASDAESDIASVVCSYGKNNNNETTGTIKNDKCEMSNLVSGTKYYYKIIATNNSGLTKELTGSFTSGSTQILFTLTNSPSNTEYAQYKSVKVTFNSKEVTTPTYYIKTTVATTGSIEGISCGTNTDPGTCSKTATKNYNANTWYKVTSNTDIKFISNGTLYARIDDGKIYSSAETMTITKIDTTPPLVTLGNLIKTTKTIKIPFTASDSESGIDSTVCKYGTSTNYGKVGEISNNTCIITGNANTKYYYSITATNGSGLTTTKTGDTISGSTAISLSLTQYPTTTEYAQYKNVQVTFSAKEVTTPTYYIKTTVATTGSIEGISCGTNTDPGTCSKTATKNYNANTWYKVTGNTNVKFTSNGTLYARVNDGESYSSAETMTITKIDTTSPNLTLGNLTKTTKTIKIPFIASDSESGIDSTVCKYGTSTNYGKDGKISNNTCIITGNANTKYYYSITTTNGSGLTTTKTGDTISGSTSISLSLTQYPTTTEYAQYKNVQVTFSTKEVTNPTYYVKATVNVSGSVTGIPCGTNTEPGACKETSTTSYAANTWYKVNSNTNIKFTSNGTLYARVNDGESYSSSETLTITKIDTTSPNLTLGNLEKTTKTVKIPFTASDSESGIDSIVCKYGTSTSYDKDGEIKNNKCEMKSLTSNTTYYYKVVTTNKAGLTKTVTGDTVSGSTAISLSLTQYPTSTEYAQYKVVKAKFTSNNVTTPTYYIKTTVATIGNVSGISCGTGNDPSTCQGTSTTNYAANTWYKVSSNTDITFKANGTLYARVNDGESYSSAETMTITKIDTTPPDLVLGSLKQTTKKTTIPFTASDSESGIDGTTCKYGTSTSYDKDGVIANSKCEMKGLTSNTKYYYILVTTNKAGLTKTVTGDTVSGVTTISFDMTKYPLDTSYSQYKNVQVTFNASNVSVPTYYIKTTVATTGNVSGISCGTGNDPSTCQGTSTTSYAANTWYKVPSSVKVNFTDNGTVYARVNDGEIYSSAETFTVTNIDKTPPLVELGAATTTTSSISIPIKASDPESRLKSLTCVYGTSTSYGTTASISNNICQLPNLSSGTKYYYKVTAINNAGRITEVKGETTTGVSSIDIGLTQYPTSTSYAQYKTASIKFTATSISTPTYYVKTTVATTGSLAGVPCGTSNDPSTCQGTSTTNYAANTWYKVTGNTNVKFKSNGTVYARINDGKIYSSAETMTITKIDTTSPNLTLGTAATTTSTIVFDVSTSDLESGIASTVCKYGTSTSYGYTGEIKNNKCIIKNNVVSGTTYYYQVTTTNNAGLPTTKTGSIPTGITSISFAKTSYPTNTKYAQYQTITTTFTAKNVTTPTYYVKTTVATTSSIAGISCGTSTDPSTCQGTSTTSYAANTWYKVTGNPSIKFTSSGTLYARINDGEKFTSAETYTITEVIDPTPPNLSVTASSTTNSISLKITASDSESGIKSTTCEYGTSTSYGSKGTIQNGVCVATGLSQNTLYYYRVITTNGSGLSTTKTGSIKTLSIEGEITISPTPTTWSKSKTVKISVTNQTSGTTLQYRMVSGTTVKKDWTSIPNGGTATINWTATTSNPTYIYARLYDGKNTTSPASATVTTNDADNPICTNTITDYTLSSVTVNMNCSDVGSGINKYYYSIDGASYTESTSKTYKFNGLHVSTIKLKVTDNVGNQTEYTLSESEKNTFYSNIHNLLNTKYTNMVNNQFLTSHPVGSIYMTTSSDENTVAKMASKYGGTWEVYAKGRTIMGYDSSNSSFSTIEGTGGSATTTLSTGNLPSHTHSISHTHTVPQTTITEGAHTHTTGSGTASYSFSVSASGSHSHGFAQGARDAMAIDTPNPSADVQRNLPYSWGYEYLTNSGWWHGWNKRLSSKTTSAGDHSHTVSGSATIPALSIGSSGSHSHTAPAMTTSAASAETSGSTGSGTAFSRLSPYVTVYIYKRVS
mgnify:CR=1 FL=1